MALTAQQISDLIVGTQKELGKLRWTNIAMQLQDYVAMPQIMQKEKVQFDGGVGIQRNIKLKHSGAAKHVGMFEADKVVIANTLTTINTTWRHTTTNYAISRREINMNKGPQRLVDLVKVRRTDAMESLAELMEDTIWGTRSEDDDVTPDGIFTWLNRYDGANTALGFNGKKPDGWTNYPGGLNHERFRNFTGQYTEWTKADLIKKLREAYRRINFKAPVATAGYERGAPRRVIYVNHDTISALEDLGENQNENLGRDLASMDGKMCFRGIPIQWVPQLDSDNGDPVVMIDWSVIYPVFLKGEYMNETAMDRSPDQHTVFRTFIDLTWNLLCVDRRRLAILSKDNVAGG